jgi:hypothetical protein
MADYTSILPTYGKKRSSLPRQVVSPPLLTRSRPVVYRSSSALAAFTSAKAKFPFIFHKLIASIGVIRSAYKERQAVYLVEREQRNQKRTEYKDAVLKKHQCRWFKRCPLTEESRSRTNCFIRSLKGFPLLKVEKESKRWIDFFDKLDEAARARFSSSSPVSVADIEQLARVSGNNITMVFSCNGLQRLVRFEHCDNHIQNAEASLLVEFLPGGTMGHSTICTRAEREHVRLGNVQLANEKEMEVINKLLIGGDMVVDPHATVAAVGVVDHGITDGAMLDEEVADAPLVVEVAEVSMTVAPPTPTPIPIPIPIPTPTPIPTPIHTPTSSQSSPIQTGAVVSSTFGQSKVVLPVVLSPNKIDADSRPPPPKKPFQFQYKENTWGRGPPTSIPVADLSSTPSTSSIWALGPPTTIPVTIPSLGADVSVWGRGPPTSIPVADLSSSTSSSWGNGPPTSIPVGPTTLAAVDVSVWGRGPPTSIPLSSSPLSSSSRPKSDPVDKKKYNQQRKERRRITQDRKKHLHRTLFNRFLILFGHLPSFERTNEKTMFEYERNWRHVAFNNLPGCSVAKCPTGRNSGGYIGGWTIIHAMAASLKVTPESLQMKLSAYLARCAVIAEPLLQEELFRFLTPADEETVAVLVENGLPLLLTPGNCTFQHKSAARNSYQDATGTTLSYSITEQVEQLIAKAVDACYEGVEFHVTRLAEEEYPIENLKSVALAQMSVEKTIISLVWEGGNTYAAALIKKGALEEREKQQSELLVAALTSATAAKEAFERSGMCRCRDEARSKRIPTCAIPESCICKENGFFCVLGYCGCTDDGLCKSYTASKDDTCLCGKACLPPSPSVTCSTCGIQSHPLCVEVAAGIAGWNCKRCVQINPRLDLANSFDDQLIVAQKALQSLLFARSIERLDNTAEDVLLFVQKEWNLRVENAEVMALQAGDDDRIKMNERTVGDRKSKKEKSKEEHKHFLDERRAFEKEEKRKEKQAAAEDAISAKRAEDASKVKAAADLADEEQIEREIASPVNTRWLSFFQQKWGLAGDEIYNTFQSFLEAARNKTQTVFVSGSTSSKIAGFTGPEPGDFDIYTTWELWQDGARHAEYEMHQLLERVQHVANRAEAKITYKKRAYGFRKQDAPFGKSNSGDILDVTVSFKGVSKPLVLQYLLRNPDWTPLQVVELFYTSHKQVYHLWDGKKFEEEFSSAASASMREKYCTVSAQRLLQLCGNAVRFLSLTAKEASMLFRSVVGILADTLDPANTDGDKAAVLRLRGKPTPYNKSPVTIQEKKNQLRHEREIESLSNLLKKRCYFISKDSTSSGGGVNARTPEAVTTSLRIISQQLADLASRVYKDSVYGQTFDWQKTLLNLAECCRNPAFAAPITSLIGKKFSPSDLSPLLTDMARKAPDRVRTSRVGSKPAPRPTRPRVAKAELMTTIKKSLLTSVRGTLVERQQIVAKLRQEAETMAVIAPAASRLVASALLYYFNNPGSQPVLLNQKATSGETHLRSAYLMALTGGLQRKGTKNIEVNEASAPTIMRASKRFFADRRNHSIVYPDRTEADRILLNAQAVQMSAELARYYNMEKKSKLHINLGCLMRRTILTLSDTTYFRNPLRKASWVKFALNGSGKSHAPVIQGLVDEILKVNAKGLKSTTFVALDGVHSTLVKLKLISEKEPIPSFLLDIVKSYSDIFWAKFKGVLPKKMRHADLKALLCEDNNKVECVARLYHHILKLNQSWAAELSDAAKKKEGLALGVAELIGDVCPAKDNVNEDEDHIDGLDEELHPELEDDEQEQADQDDDEEEEVDENANMDEEAVHPSASSNQPPPPPPALFDPFAQGRGKRELWGKYFYPKSFFIVPQHKKKIRSIAVVGDYIKLAFKDFPAVKSVIAREAQLRKDKENVNEHYMAAIFDRPIRKKETLGASVVTNGHYCSILYNKFGYIPEDMELRFPQYKQDQNKPLFYRHRDAERFDEPAPGSSVRHWRRIVSVDPGKHNLLTCFEILPNGTERSYKLTQEAYKIATNYDRRNARSALRCKPLTAPSEDGTPGAFQRLCEPDAWGKTADSAAFETHMSIVAAVSPSIFAVTLKTHWADEAFRTWQAKMKCLDRFWSMIKAGSLEDGTFGVQPIFAYGDGQFASSSRGRVSAPTTATYKSCLKINYQCNVVLTCEHRSTWTCSSCEKPLQGLRPGNVSHTQDAKEAKHYKDIASGRKNPNKKWFSPLGKILHGLKKCTNSLCPNAVNSFVDRDVNACRNILRAFHFADQNPENAETNGPAKPPHMDASNKVLHAAERKAAPKPARLPTRGCYTDSFKVPAGPGHTERHVQRLKARAAESILLESTAPMSGLPGCRSNIFPTSMINEGKGGGTWRMDEWPLGPSNRRSPPSTAFIQPSPPPSPTRFREEKRERRSAEVLKTMRIYAAVAAGAYPTSSISSFNTFTTSPSRMEFKPSRIIQKFTRFLPYMQTQDFNNLPVQPTTTSSGFLTSRRHILNSVGGRFLSTTTFPVFFDGFSNLAESLPQQQKSASNGARG